jgi:hypothetical protein
MENRSGLIVAAALTKATGTAERTAAEEMIVRHSPGASRITLGADKGYDAASFVADMRALNVTPHIAQIPRGLQRLDKCPPKCEFQQPAAERARRRRLDQEISQDLLLPAAELEV